MILILNTEQVSHHPYVPEEKDSDSESEECETISYTMVCKELEEITDGDKLPIECKVAMQNIENKPGQQELELHSSMIEVLNNVSPSEMKEAEQVDPTICQIVQWVKTGKFGMFETKLSQIRKEKSRSVRK